MKKRTHDRMFTFSPRHVWRGGFLLLALVLTTALIAYAGASNPGFLNENTSDISAGNHSYRVWYTTSCDDGSSSDCECDSALDKDTDGDGVDDTDSPNDCIATSDSDGDGIFDTGADSDGDGVLNLMDLGWTNSGTGVVESTPLNVQRSVNRYVNDWGLKDPKWDRDENRNIYVYDIGVNGRAFGDGSGELYDTRLQMLTNMDSRATVLHELWHNEQYAYSAGGGAWLMEGQAAFLEDKVFQDLDRYAPSWHHGLVDGYLGNPVKVKREDRDDDGKKEFAQTIGLTGRSYQATLWWTYVAEQAGTQYLGTTWEGVDALEAVLEQSDDHGRKGKDAVDRVLRDRLGQGFDDTFWDFTVANYAKEFDLTELDHGYLHGRDPEEVLQYRDEVLTGTSPVSYDPVGRTTIGGTDLTGGKSGGVNAKSSEISSTTTMPAYGARYYEADLTSVSECPLVYWQVEAGYGQWREIDGSELSGGQNPLLTADDRLPPLGEFWVEGYTGHTYTDTVISKTVILHFTPRPEYQNVRLYRASGSAAGFAKVGDFDPSVGKIVDRGLVNDREYFYYLQPVGASGVMGRPSLVRRAEPAIDPVPPKATVIINDGDQFAHSRTVSVTVQGSDDIAYMQVSNSPDLDGAPLQAYQDEFSWTLDPDPDTGVAFVYVQLQDEAGNESEVFGAGIVYKPPIALPGGLLDLGRVLADFRPFPDYTIYYELLNFTGLGLGGGASGMGQLNAAQGNEPLYHAGLSFDLEARDAMSQPVTEFEELYTLTVSYEDWQWRSAGIGSEGSLNLYWNADQGWEPVLPCEGCSHDVEENVIVARLDHLTEFVLMGEPPVPIYLPLILKGF